MTRRVALATCSEFPELDPDDGLLLPALAALGVEAVPAVWDDAAVDWAAFDLVVVRGTWDYAPRRDRFLRWARAVEAVSALANPADVIEWNTDKRYLGELAEAGIPVVPTRYIGPDEDVVVPPDGEYVVKPTVSAGSRDTARYHAGRDRRAAAAHIGRLLREGRTAMLQPYLEAVDTAGETALLYIDGAFSHGIRKGPLLRLDAPPVEALFAEEDISPRTPSPAQHEVAEAVRDHLPGGLLYTRIDLLDTPEGPVVLEVELTEPSMFLSTADGAAARFAEAIAARLPR